MAKQAPVEQFLIESGERSKTYLRLLFCAVSGGGKSASLLRVAGGLLDAMVEMGIDTGPRAEKIGIINAERKSIKLYQGRQFVEAGASVRVKPFAVIELTAPYTPERYVAAARQLHAAGFRIIGIDQISAAWAGSGGLLEKKNELAKGEDSDGFRAFNQITPMQNKFIEDLLSIPAHMIVTARSHTKWALETYRNRAGEEKTKVRRVGMAPIQRPGTEYEFTTVLNLDNEGNVATVINDVSGVFGAPGTVVGQLKEAHGRMLADWLYTGKDFVAAGVDATPLEKLEASVVTWEHAIPNYLSIPDLAAQFARAWKELGAFTDVDVEARSKARARVKVAYDKRRAELEPKKPDQAPEPTDLLLTPDEVTELEDTILTSGVAIELVYQQFGIVRLSQLKQARLDEVLEWIAHHPSALSEDELEAGMQRKRAGLNV